MDDYPSVGAATGRNARPRRCRGATADDATNRGCACTATDWGLPAQLLDGQNGLVEPAAMLFRRRGGRPSWSLSAVTLVALVSGCTGPADGDAAAVWTVAPGQDIDAGTSELTVLVSRFGCNSGVTGEVQRPGVELQDDRLVLTFTVRPGEPSAGDCQGNGEVPYDVALPEALGNRRLIDGQCLANPEAKHSSFCSSDGVRYGL